MRPRTLAAMTKASTLELVRDRKTLFYVALYPFCLLGLFLGMAAMMPDRPDSTVDLGRFFLATGLLVALASVAFYGVAVPLVALRERGTLRLLSTTPVSRLTVMLAQAPARLGLALAQTVIIAALAAASGYLPVERIGSLFVTCLATLVLLVSFGFLLGSLLPTAEAATNTLTFALLALLALAGLFLPFDRLPERAGDILSVLPPGLLGNAIQHDLIGIPARHPTWIAWLAALACAAVFALIATRTFRWDNQRR
ncbi:ABC transporter permease [Allorhizocola rhizosphaerae]|uniref:ABC transporter permease n=1 Tax=Allorhizocola rhizosphaerae TaxID=1872709 RepID=UPI000E3BCB59|nr:ABC transporter permease [Allorhizocola rhizosphaerae]